MELVGGDVHRVQLRPTFLFMSRSNRWMKQANGSIQRSDGMWKISIRVFHPSASAANLNYVFPSLPFSYVICWKTVLFSGLVPMWEEILPNPSQVPSLWGQEMSLWCRWSKRSKTKSRLFSPFCQPSTSTKPPWWDFIHVPLHCCTVLTHLPWSLTQIFFLKRDCACLTRMWDSSWQGWAHLWEAPFRPFWSHPPGSFVRSVQWQCWLRDFLHAGGCLSWHDGHSPFELSPSLCQKGPW